MNKKFPDLKIKYKVWLENKDNNGILGDGKWKLLKSINETGSLKAAIENQGLSYRKTWDNLKKAEKLLGFPLIKPTRGGSRGGRTVLTQKGLKLVAAFDSFHEEFDNKIQEAFSLMINKLKND